MPARVSIEALAAAGALIFLRLYQPVEALWCPFLYLSGIPCPLCGMTRALAALTRFDLGRAMDLHILSPAIAAILISVLLGFRPPARVWQSLGIAFALLGAVRIAGHTL